MLPCSQRSVGSSPVVPGTSSARGSCFAVAGGLAVAPRWRPTTDESEFLPDHYESIKAYEPARRSSPAPTPPSPPSVVFDHEDGDAAAPRTTWPPTRRWRRSKDDARRRASNETFVQPVTRHDPDGRRRSSPRTTTTSVRAQLLLSDGSTGYEPEALDDGRRLRTRGDSSRRSRARDSKQGSPATWPRALDNEECQSSDALLIVGVATDAADRDPAGPDLPLGADLPDADPGGRSGRPWSQRA